MNSLAESILYVYLIVFFSMLFFDIFCIFYRKINDNRTHKLEIKIENWILGEGEVISEKHIKMLIRKLPKISYFIAFVHVVDRMDKKRQKSYLIGIKSVFSSICSHYQKEEVIRQTYFVYFLRQHPYIYKSGQNGMIHYLLQSVTSSSVYLRENALNALYVTGNVSRIREAFYQLSYLHVVHHPKLLTDGLLKFQGDVDELASMLISELEYYQENQKVAAINYFSYQKIDCKKHILRIMTDEAESKEVRIACIRYFSNVLCDFALPSLYKFIQDDKKNWEYAAISVNTLRKYPGKETVKYLIVALQSHNWYVRNNAASSLLELVSEQVADLVIAKLNDRYAKEALEYQLYLRGENEKLCC